MGVKLKSYSEYKDSNVPWLGKIPRCWSLQRAKWYLKSKKEINADGACTDVLSLTLRGVVDNDPDNPEGLVPSDYRSYQIFEKNDLVFKLIDLENYRTSRVGLVHKRGIMSPAYIRVTVDSKNLSPKFYYYFYYSLYLQGVYNRIGAGVRATLSANDLLDLPIPVLEKQEQEKIVLFLDCKLSQIAHFIKKKRRIIELLNEQKQVIINQAVTRGIDPNVRLKPSGIDWLGDIPEHWTVLSLRRIGRSVKTGGTPPGAEEKYFSTDGFNWYTPSDFKDELYLGDSERRLSSLGKEYIKIFPPNTVMMIGIGGTIGKVSISKCSAGCNQQINGIIVNKKMIVEFLVYYLRFLKEHIVKCGKYTTLPIINQEETKSLLLLLPSLTEQEQIIKHIEDESKEIDLAISRIKHEIDLIREYRTRLISDVVTGKIDVRDIPVEPSEEPEGYEELDMVEEAEKQEEKMEELEEVQNEDV